VKKISKCNQEDGDDFGGLTREFFSLVSNEASSVLIQGCENNFSPIHDVERLEKEEYKVYGYLIAAAMKHGCSGPRNLCTAVASAILNIDGFHAEIEDIPDFDVQSTLHKIVAADEEESIKLMRSCTERFDAGLPSFNITIDKNMFCRLIAKHRVIDINCREIEQIREGIVMADLLETLQSHKSEAMAEMCFQGSLSSSEFRDLFNFRYSSKEKEKEKEEDVIYNLIQFIEDLEREGSFPLEYTDPFTGLLIIKNVTVNEVLQHFTGSINTSANIRNRKIKVYFEIGDEVTGRGAGMTVNTCDMSLTFPLIKSFIDEDQFRSSFLFCMANSPGFTKA